MTTTNFSYDYTKCMMMKILVAELNKKGETKVNHNTEQILELVKSVDNLTVGITKIIYLIGWQYNGHDDKYPDFFEVNECLKSKGKTAYENLIWLMAEAKKYNTILSFHINFNDAYSDAPSYDEFVRNNALIRKKNGKPWAIEKYNGKGCYKTSFKEYWESGLFKKQIDKLLMLFPIKEAKTVHVDNFQCYSNVSPSVKISEMQIYRDKMIAYLRESGIDITTEFTAREHDGLKNTTYFGLPRDHHKDQPIDILGKIPAVWWWTYMSDKELIDIKPSLFTGGLLRNGIRNDYRGEFIYGNIHGEEEFKKRKDGNGIWQKEFLESYATVQVPFHFLCKHKRLAIEGSKKERYCVYQDNIISYRKGQIITRDGNIIKDGGSLCLPYGEMPNAFFAYSKEGDNRKWKLNEKGFTKAKLVELSLDNAPRELSEVDIIDGTIELNIKRGQALLIICR